MSEGIGTGSGGGRREETRLSPFFLFGVAIESASVTRLSIRARHPSTVPLSPPIFLNNGSRDCMVFLVGLLESA